MSPKKAMVKPKERASQAASPKMLADALIMRADLQRRITQLKERLLRNAKIQEGDAPAEDPADLMRQLEDVTANLVSLIQRINRTNSTSMLDDGMSISDAIARRDGIRTRHQIYRELAAAATITQGRTTRSEVKFRSTVSVKDVQRIADDLAREYRDLDTQIQSINWTKQLAD
ncbi:MAG TPA: DIP1984 family protein [Dehalococcoidia bacterium]